MLLPKFDKVILPYVDRCSLTWYCAHMRMAVWSVNDSATAVLYSRSTGKEGFLLTRIKYSKLIIRLWSAQEVELIPHSMYKIARAYWLIQSIT